MAEVNVATTRIELEANTQKFTPQVKEAAKGANDLGEALGRVEGRTKSLASNSSKATKPISDVGKSANNAGKDAEKGANKFGVLFNQLKRIATYRLIRTALKNIVSGFREGIANLYQWSALNDTRFKESMDNLATSILYIKNIMGTALAPVIQDIVVPAIYAISEAVADAVNWLNQLIAILKGESTYTKAIRKQTEYAKATGGAAKELRRMLLGFDEINRLEAPNGGGGGSAIDYDGMFETTAVDEKLAARLEGLKLTIGDVLFDWSDLNGEQICEKIIAGLGVLAGGVAGFMIGGVPGAVIGSLAGLGFTLITDSIVFNHDGTVSENEILSMLAGTLGALVGGVIGFNVGGPAGALIGASLGAGITLLASTMLFKKDAKGKTGLANTELCAVLQGIAAGLITFALAGSVVGGVLVATLTVGMILSIRSVSWTGKDLVTNAIKDIEKQGGSINGAVNMMDEMEKASKATPNSVIEKYTADGKKKTAELRATTRADGGYVDAGSLFIAGEAGAEFVGNINGRTGVMNTDQFGAVMQPTTMAIYEIGNAIVGAVNNIPVPSVKIGDRDIYRASERGKRLTGSSLVVGAR